MSRKVTLQVFGTNAPAETRQPAEYIFDVQSVEMVLDIGGSVEWLAAILKNTEGTHYLAPTWLQDLTPSRTPGTVLLVPDHIYHELFCCERRAGS